MMYLTVTPLVLWPTLGWWTPAGSMVICLLLLGTENIGALLFSPPPCPVLHAFHIDVCVGWWSWCVLMPDSLWAELWAGWYIYIHMLMFM